ncbi:MAG: hypothetical protein ACXW2F_09720, partial [Thermoanaerobaculia bacterium]
MLFQIVHLRLKMLRLNRVVKDLGAVYGAIAVTTLEPFEHILLENAAYLVDDQRRWRTFQTLREKIGVTPEAILRRNVSDLAGVIAEGGANWWDAFQLVPVTRGFWHHGVWFDVFPVRHHLPDTAFGL